MRKFLPVILVVVILLLVPAIPVLAANATTSMHIVKYAENGTVIGETTVTYELMEDNLTKGYIYVMKRPAFK